MNGSYYLDAPVIETMPLVTTDLWYARAWVQGVYASRVHAFQRAYYPNCCVYVRVCLVTIKWPPTTREGKTTQRVAATPLHYTCHDRRNIFPIATLLRSKKFIKFFFFLFPLRVYKLISIPCFFSIYNYHMWNLDRRRSFSEYFLINCYQFEQKNKNHTNLVM